jgi:hypothetical protein
MCLASIKVAMTGPCYIYCKLTKNYRVFFVKGNFPNFVAHFFERSFSSDVRLFLCFSTKREVKNG